MYIYVYLRVSCLMAAREALQGNEQVANDVKRLLHQTTGGQISAEAMQELLQGGEVRTQICLAHPSNYLLKKTVIVLVYHLRRILP